MNILYDPFKNDVFGFGLILLQCAMIQDGFGNIKKDTVHMNNGGINWNVIFSGLQAVAGKYSAVPILYEALHRMLAENELNRIDWINLQASLPPRHQIQRYLDKIPCTHNGEDIGGAFAGNYSMVNPWRSHDPVFTQGAATDGSFMRNSMSQSFAHLGQNALRESMMGNIEHKPNRRGEIEVEKERPNDKYRRREIEVEYERQNDQVRGLMEKEFERAQNSTYFGDASHADPKQFLKKVDYSRILPTEENEHVRPSAMKQQADHRPSRVEHDLSHVPFNEQTLNYDSAPSKAPRVKSLLSDKNQAPIVHRESPRTESGHKIVEYTEPIYERLPLEKEYIKGETRQYTEPSQERHSTHQVGRSKIFLSNIAASTRKSEYKEGKPVEAGKFRPEESKPSYEHHGNVVKVVKGKHFGVTNPGDRSSHQAYSDYKIDRSRVGPVPEHARVSTHGKPGRDGESRVYNSNHELCIIILVKTFRLGGAAHWE